MAPPEAPAATARWTCRSPRFRTRMRENVSKLRSCSRAPRPTVTPMGLRSAPSRARARTTGQSLLGSTAASWRGPYRSPSACSRLREASFDLLWLHGTHPPHAIASLRRLEAKSGSSNPPAPDFGVANDRRSRTFAKTTAKGRQTGCGQKWERVQRAAYWRTRPTSLNWLAGATQPRAQHLPPCQSPASKARHRSRVRCA